MGETPVSRKTVWVVLGVLALALMAIAAGSRLIPSALQPKAHVAAPPAKSNTKANPESVAEAGVKLKRVSKPPVHTLAMLDPSKATANARYAITFEPYGKGPGSTDSGGLAIAVRSAQPMASSYKKLELDGRNVLVDTPDASVAVTKGGTYAGTLKLIERGGVLVPTLTDARPK